MKNENSVYFVFFLSRRIASIVQSVTMSSRDSALRSFTGLVGGRQRF